MKRRVVVRTGFAAGLEGTAVPFRNSKGWDVEICYPEDIPDSDVEAGQVDHLYYEAEELDFLEDQ